MKLTLAAFYGEKPLAFAKFIEAGQALVSARIPRGFEPYELAQVHATIIGLEGRWIDGALYNENWLRRGEHRQMDIASVVAWVRSTPLLPFKARIGGYRRDESYGFLSFGRHPYERSFEVQATNAVVAIGWPVANGAFTSALDALRRELSRFNVLHKYYTSDVTIDNDLFFVLGTVATDAIGAGDRVAISDAIRAEVAEMEPAIVDVTRGSLALVRYEDPRLPLSTSVRYPIELDELTRGGYLVDVVAPGVRGTGTGSACS